MKKLYFLSLFILFFSSSFSQTYQWAKSIGSNSLDVSQSLALDPIGNVYTTGFFFNTADFDPGFGIYNMTPTGNCDIYISKLDANGNFLWAKQIGGTSQDMSRSIFTDASGNFYLTGKFYGTVDFDPGPGTFTLSSPLLSAASSNAFVGKYDSNGNLIWAKSFYAVASEGISIYADPSGNVYTSGTFDNSADFDPGPTSYSLTSFGNRDIFISKLDVNGNFLWAKNMGGAGDYNYGNQVILDPSGNVYLTGIFLNTVDFDPGPGFNYLTSAGNYDVFVTKFNPAGNFIWAKRLGGIGGESGGVQFDSFGNIYLAGYFNGSVDFDLGPSTFSITSTGNSDGFVLKMDNAGNFLWAKKIGGAGYDYLNAFALDANKFIYTAGSFENTVDFDPGPGISNVTSVGYADIYFLKLDSNGVFTWVKSIGGSGGDEFCYSLALDGVGNMFATGVFSVTTNFNPPSAAIINPVGEFDVFIAKYSTTNVGIEEKEVKNNILFYPNPTEERIYFFETINYIEVFDVNGKKLKGNFNAASIDVSELQNGIYFIRIKTDRGEFNKKFIKE